MRRALGILVLLVVGRSAAGLLPYPWNGVALASSFLLGVAGLVLIVRGVLRDPGFVAVEGYEHHRQTPDHVRDAGTVEGVVLPEKRLSR
jgi:hypothetical protein